MAKKVVVIRIGADTTHIVHMEYTNNNPTIFGCVRIATPENVYNDGMIVDAMTMGRRITRACLDKGINAKDAIFTVVSSRIANRETTIPVVAKSKVQQVVMAKVADLFPIDSERYVFSHVLQGKEYENKGADKDESGGKVQDAHIYAAPSDMINSYYALASAANLRVLSIEADGNSVFQIMRRQVKEGVTMAVQINRDSTLVNVIDGDRLYLQRVVPYGVNVFADAVQQEGAFEAETYEKAFDLLTKQKVLMNMLNADNPNDDFSLEKRIDVTDNAEYLISNISRVMEYYNTRYREREIDRIVCVGPGCSVVGLPELLSNELGLRVTVPNALEGVRFNRRVTIDTAILQYLNCFGSVFAPLGFVPREIAAQDAKKGSLTGAVLIFAGLLLISAVLAGFSFVQVYVTTEERDKLQARVQAMAPVENQYNELKQIETNYGLLGKLKTYVDSNNNHLHALMKTLSDMVPRSFRIESIQSDEQKVTLTASSEDKLVSVTALEIQLGKVEGILGVWIDSVAETKEPLTNRRRYAYTLTFLYENASTQEGEVQ